MLYLLKPAALCAVLSVNVLTLSSAPASAGETGLPTLDARWVVFDFVSGIRTVKFADGSLHEDLFEPEPLAPLP
jgi:hypothetical protein